MAFFDKTIEQTHIQTLQISDRPPNNARDLVDRSAALAAENFRLQNKIIEGGTRGKKRKRIDSKDADKSEEVIQIRAKSGQATYSHSLAERVRRKKINERLKCLQTLVPGCNKTMGRAVMLDAVISYVQSLQNQIELLSMKLWAASMNYDFNWPSTNAINTTQGTNIFHVARDMEEKMDREGIGGFCHNFH